METYIGYASVANQLIAFISNLPPDATVYSKNAESYNGVEIWYDSSRNEIILK